MQDESPYVPVLPEHPELRELALVIESAGMMGEILDPSFLCVFFSSESARAMGLSADEASSMIGKSLLVRGMTKEYAELARLTEDSGIAWFQQNAPIMRRFLEPGTPEFDEAFGTTAKFAAEIDPVEEAPRAWLDLVTARPHLRWQRTILGDQNQAQIRINDDSGRFIGILFLYRGTVPESLLHRLGRGDPGVFKRMERVSEPARRPAGILFADLEASGVLSRRLSSRGYFDLIRDLTDLIDSSVIARDGITGKHAGDGGSALFLAADFEGSESADAGAIPVAAI